MNIFHWCCKWPAPSVIMTPPTKVTDELVQIILGPGLEPGAAEVFLEFICYSGGPLPEELVPQVKCPILIAWGDKDPWEPIDIGRNYGNFDFVEDFIVLPNVGHCPQRHSFDGFPGSLKAKHNGLPKLSPTLSGTLSFPSFLQPGKVSKCSNEERLMLKRKDVPQTISGSHELHKDELHNVVAVTEMQPSLRQRRTQAKGETRRTPWDYPFRDSFLS
ncbi:hypothetical protein JHK82_024773 [Glycine max]|nr:hypothetical protein JHK86_024891 [Glycine max]KAG5133585.1 hypothetical protein JHK82_024773 [Glycine max]